MKKLFFLLLMFCTSLVFSQTDSTKVDNFKETDKVLSKILDKSLVVAEKTGQFVIEQAPDVLKEFYIWHTAKHIFWILVSIGIFALGRFLPKLWMKNKKDGESWRTEYKFFNYYGDEGSAIASWLVFACLFITFIPVFLIHMYDLVFIICSPKLYLIEYLLSLRQS